MALVFYARVSSKSQNLDRQLARAKEVEADKVFTDKFSGKNTNRPGLHELFSYVREGDTVEVVSLDRLSRNYQDIQHLVQELKSKGVSLIVDDLPQTHTGNNLVDQFMLDMMINLMGFVAQNEREKIKERQRQGIEQAKKRGVYKGRPTKFSEDSSDREGRLVFESIKKDYQAGNYKSKAGLARKYGLSRQQLYRIINRIEESEKAND
jgi:DNA invertase Pin-like site-specific DNA recombinase